MLAPVKRAEPWSDPELYDLGFSFDTAEELAFFCELFRRHRAAPTTSLLDLACGPGRFLLRQARAGWRVVGVDASAEMIAHCRERARTAGLAVELHRADMTSHRVSPPCDVALCGRDSINYLLEDGALEQHFAAVAASLAPDGLYVIDTSLFPPGRYRGQRRWTWSDPTPQGTLQVRYRILRPPTADERCYEEQLEVRLEPESGPPRRLIQRAVKRAIAAGELEAVAAATGVFTVVERYADLDTDATLRRAARPDRLILVLRVHPREREGGPR